MKKNTVKILCNYVLVNKLTNNSEEFSLTKVGIFPIEASEIYKNDSDYVLIPVENAEIESSNKLAIVYQTDKNAEIMINTPSEDELYYSNFNEALENVCPLYMYNCIVGIVNYETVVNTLTE